MKTKTFPVHHVGREERREQEKGGSREGEMERVSRREERKRETREGRERRDTPRGRHGTQPRGCKSDKEPKASRRMRH